MPKKFEDTVTVRREFAREFLTRGDALQVAEERTMADMLDVLDYELIVAKKRWGMHIRTQPIWDMAVEWLEARGFSDENYKVGG